MGADMEAATLVEWKVAPGDSVSRGDIIAEIETEKGDIDVEVFEDGVVEEILVEPGAKLPVGTVLARIGEGGGARERGGAGGTGGERDAGEARGEREVLEERAEKWGERREVRGEAHGNDGAEPRRAGEERDETKGSPGAQVAGGDGRSVIDRPERRVRASPLARRVAADLGVDLADVVGSGPQGAIQRADVERAAAEQPAVATEEAPPEEEREEETPSEEAGAPYPERMRQAIAKAMARSNREIPHYYLETSISMQRALDWLEGENALRSVTEHVLPVVLLMKATVRALDDVPALNAYWRNDRHEPQEPVHLGVAISLRQGGLVIPAIRNADRKSLDELMANLDDLITRSRSGHLRSSELTSSTITMTNLGDLGVETVHGVIYPPQVALVGFGKITERPWAEDGMLGVRPVVTATVAADHRATDGRQGAKFLDALNGYLQKPESL